MFDRGNFISDEEFVCGHGSICVHEQITGKNLWSLHCVKPFPIDSRTDKVIFVRSL